MPLASRRFTALLISAAAASCTQIFGLDPLPNESGTGASVGGSSSSTSSGQGGGGNGPNSGGAPATSTDQSSSAGGGGGTSTSSATSSSTGDGGTSPTSDSIDFLGIDAACTVPAANCPDVCASLLCICAASCADQSHSCPTGSIDGLGISVSNNGTLYWFSLVTSAPASSCVTVTGNVVGNDEATSIQAMFGGYAASTTLVATPGCIGDPLLQRIDVPFDVASAPLALLIDDFTDDGVNPSIVDLVIQSLNIEVTAGACPL